MVCFNRNYHFVFISFLEMILTANGHLVVCIHVYTRVNHFLFIYFSFPIALREMIPCRICYCLLGLTNQNRMFQTVRPIKCLLSNACVKNLAPIYTFKSENFKWMDVYELGIFQSYDVACVW